MQQVSGIARRYARALFRLAGNDLKKARTLLKQFDSIVELYGIEMAAKVLQSPAMPKDLKISLLNYAMSKSPEDPEVKRFVNSIVDAGRIAEFPAIISAFSALIDEREGRLAAEVTSVVPLKDDVLASIKAAIGESGKVDLHNVVDKSILGGLVVKVGNKIVDLSFKSRLNDIANSALS